MMVDAFTLVIIVVALLAIRVAYVLRSGGNVKCNKPCARTLIVIGSGGHTSEMIRHIQRLNPTLYRPRLYVLADSDTTSKSKIKSVESHFRALVNTEHFVKQIPRSRNVGQNYISSILTTLYSIIACIPVVLSFKPDLILCNGPGTCIPVCLIGFLLKVLFLTRTKIVFIESICRVKTLSLSGKILLRFADKVLVQWSELHEKYPKTEYIGRLM